MERRLAITYAVSATATLCTASIAIATVSGGLFVSAAPALKGGAKQVELIDDYIVVHSPDTTTAVTSADPSLERSYIVAPAPESTVATTAAPAPVVVAAQAPSPAPAVLSTPSEMSVSEVESPEPAATEPARTTDERSDDHSGDRHRSDGGHEREHEPQDGEHEGGGD